MNIKILQDYLKICSNAGAVGTPSGFYNYVKDNYPNEIRRINMDLILKLWKKI